MSSLRSRPPARPRGTSRVRLLAGAGVVVIAAAIAFGLWRATSGNDASTVPVAALPGYTEGVAGAWQRINPLFATTNDVDADLSSLVFSGLLRIGPDGQVGPDLADALPDVADEGRTYTFHLRKGLTWQEGAPLTSVEHRVHCAGCGGDAPYFATATAQGQPGVRCPRCGAACSSVGEPLLGALAKLRCAPAPSWLPPPVRSALSAKRRRTTVSRRPEYACIQVRPPRSGVH